MIEVGRNDGAQPPKGLNAAMAVLQGGMSAMPCDPGLLGGGGDAGAGGRKPRLHSRDQEVRAVFHAPEVGAEFCEWQANSQKAALPRSGGDSYASRMPYEPERIRQIIRREIREKNLKLKPLAMKAKIGERTLSQFLDGNTASLRVETAYRIADGIGVSIADLLGLEPTEPKIEASAYKAMVELLERGEREAQGTAAALEAARRLARALTS